MRELIVARIIYLYKRDPQSMRWHGAWFDKEFKQHYKPSRKEIQQNSLIHISEFTQAHWDKLPDDRLVDVFEYVVARANACFG